MNFIVCELYLNKAVIFFFSFLRLLHGSENLPEIQRIRLGGYPTENDA